MINFFYRIYQNIPFWVGLSTLLLLVSPGYAQLLASTTDVRAVPPTEVSPKGQRSLGEVLQVLQEQYQTSFLYEKSLVADQETREPLDFDQALEVNLTRVLRPSRLAYEKIDDRTYVIVRRKKLSLIPKLDVRSPGDYSVSFLRDADPNQPQWVAKQLVKSYRSKKPLDKTITGTVTDVDDGGALPGVNVLAKNTTIGTITNVDGKYSLSVPDDTETLVFSSVGYAPQEVSIQGRSTIDVGMVVSTQELGEVVVIGYGEQNRREVTGAIASVSAEEISRQPVSGLDEALQGRAAGVQVTPSTGQPGAPISVNIRGVGSFGNTSPLYVIDGVPVFNEVSNLGRGQSNPLATLNPNNIASIEILKDASAAAIYGARAANGVVLITTKRGEAGETKFSFQGYYGVQQFTNRIDMMNSQQYAAYSIEADQAAGRDPVPAFTDPSVLAQNTDWQDEAFSAAPIQDYSLTVSGGGENARFALIAGVFDQEGVLPNTGFERYSLRINSDFNVGKRLKIGESVNLSRGYWQGGFGPTTDFIQELLLSSPTLPVRDPNNLGGFAGPEFDVSGRANRSNRIAELYLFQNDVFQNRMLGNVYAEYELLPGLKYRLNLGGDLVFGESKAFTPVYELGNRSNPFAILDEERRNESLYLIEHTLNYSKTLGDHTFAVLAGYTQQSNRVTTLTGNVQEFPSNDLRTVNAGFGQANLTGAESEWAIRSLLGRVNYSYKDRYLAMATIRRDGSSRFGANNRWGVFPSFSAGWQLGDEPFMEEILLIDDLKLRASWGQVGNQEIDNYAAIATIDPVARYILGTGQGLVPGATFLALGNPNLKWETSTQTDFGIDIGLLDNRLSFIADYYIKRTTDVLLRLPVATTSGIRRNRGAFQNAGEIRNSGFELAATFRESAGDFQYNLTANFSTINNEVVSLGGGEPIVVNLSQNADATTITQEGGEVGAFYGFVADGVFADQGEVDSHASQAGAAPGDVRFRDLDGDGAITPDDRRVIGSPIPDFFYGFNADLSYRGVDVSLFFQGEQGADVYNLFWAAINSGQGNNNATTEMLDRWTPGNRNTNVPRAVADDPNDNDRPSTRFLEDASYLRLRNVQVGYTFPTSLTESLNISSLRVYGTAQNLFTLTGYRSYNPDVGVVNTGNESTLTRGVDYGAYPLARVLTLGVQIDF